MPKNTAPLRSYSLREEPEADEVYRVLVPRVFVLEERGNALFAPTKQLKTAGYNAKSIFEESRVVDLILGNE